MKQRIKHNLSGANSVFQKVIDYYHSYYGGKASATNKCQPPSSLPLSLTITKWAISSNASSTPPILVGLQYGPRLCSVNLFILNVCHHFCIRLMIQFIILLFHRHNRTVILPHLDHFVWIHSQTFNRRPLSTLSLLPLSFLLPPPSLPLLSMSLLPSGWQGTCGDLQIQSSGCKCLLLAG